MRHLHHARDLLQSLLLQQHVLQLVSVLHMSSTSVNLHAVDAIMPVRQQVKAHMDASAYEYNALFLCWIHWLLAISWHGLVALII